MCSHRYRNINANFFAQNCFGCLLPLFLMPWAAGYSRTKSGGTSLVPPLTSMSKRQQMPKEKIRIRFLFFIFVIFAMANMLIFIFIFAIANILSGAAP